MPALELISVREGKADHNMRPLQAHYLIGLKITD